MLRENYEIYWQKYKNKYLVAPPWASNFVYMNADKKNPKNQQHLPVISNKEPLFRYQPSNSIIKEDHDSPRKDANKPAHLCPVNIIISLLKMWLVLMACEPV